MRLSIRCSTAAGSGLLILAAAVLTGCGAEDGPGGAAPSASESPAAASSVAGAATEADPATVQAVTDAYVTFFDAATPADQRVEAVERGTEFVPVLQAQSGNPQTQGTSAAVSAVQLVDSEHAAVTYTLSIGGNPVLPDQAGEAVKIGEKWKVAAATFCSLLAIQGGTSEAC